MIQEYHKYHTDRDNTRIGLFTELNKKFQIHKVLYPGSYTHITPSLVFPETVYVDTMKKAQSFFDKLEIYKFINDNKLYKEEHIVRFHHIDYSKSFDEKPNSFDLLLSQYAGFISKDCKKYLKEGGILVANNSHGDGDWAKFDEDFEFIGIYNRIKDTNYSIKTDNLDSYFIQKNPTEITADIILKRQRGFGYTQSPSGYIFRKR